MKFHKLRWTIILVAYFCLGYFTLNLLNVHRAYYFDVSFAFEERIPFFPVAILGYTLVFVTLIWTIVLIAERQLFRKAVISALAVSSVHFVLFYLIPVKMVLRPSIDALGGSIWDPLVRLYFVIDQPTNCFPSLHVAYPTMCTWQIWRAAPKYLLHFVCMTLIVAVSVVLVKQHYIADAVAGGAASMLICWVVDRPLPFVRGGREG